MSGFKGSKFTDRAEAAAAAKKAMLEKFRAKPAPDDPAVLARAAERKAIAEAREKRAEERRLIKEVEDARRLAEDQARQAELAAQAEAELRRKAEQAVRDEEIKAQRKAERDARYAARKARR
jgi:hypothetical protein